MGQDPYHQNDDDSHPTAQGIAFSVRSNAKIPSSLRNIYKEIKDNYPEFVIPQHGDLTEWVKQGVFLLNACLTVTPHKAGSHGKIWMGFIHRVITAICQVNNECIFVLWGAEAQKHEKLISGQKSIVLKAAHPSGMSANRGFFGNKHFKIINDKLIEQGKSPINWQITNNVLEANNKIVNPVPVLVSVPVSNVENKTPTKQTASSSIDLSIFIPTPENRIIIKQTATASTLNLETHNPTQYFQIQKE